mmetsp:Transcript_12644/g.23817  ORF Transcript_12644/g.23817 Transcript_12644/m.23817 type:complete len:245 (+) Transcript_12644:76-810(+)
MIRIAALFCFLAARHAQASNEKEIAEMEFSSAIIDKDLANARTGVDQSVAKINSLAMELPMIPGEMAAAQQAGDTAQVEVLKLRMKKLISKTCKELESLDETEGSLKKTLKQVREKVEALSGEMAANPSGSTATAPYLTKFQGALQQGGELEVRAQNAKTLKSFCAAKKAAKEAKASEAAEATKLYSVKPHSESSWHFPSFLLGAGLAMALLAVAYRVQTLTGWTPRAMKRVCAEEAMSLVEGQ